MPTSSFSPFPSCGPEPLGFYPIVDSHLWVKKLLAWGINTLQLRIKHLPKSTLEEELASSIELAKQYQARLFINDYWELALALGAYGVHLGQEDLETADCHALQRAGLRLGVSTHSEDEIERALSVCPSYIACGPIYHTDTKVMAAAPQGLSRLQAVCDRLDYPVVAIGGIKWANLEGVCQTGVDGVAVITAVTEAEDPEQEVKRWINRISELFRPTESKLKSILGSEHCAYKSSRLYLRQMVSEGPHVILGPSEDAGIIAIAQDKQGHRYGVVVSHESHNHPSQVLPYEGSATGVGGNVRDVSCMGAEVIAIGNGLRFGEINRPKTKWIHEGVVAGIANYANPIGVPTLAGDLYYDKAYNDNCLVTLVTLGLVREDEVIHSFVPQHLSEAVFILVGKATDASGFGGACFASAILNEQADHFHAVQEPNAFLKRHLLQANEALFKVLKDNQLIDQVAFKDLGAGGIGCASIELAHGGGFGAEIVLDDVPVSLEQLSPTVILCSETQERFMWAVPEHAVDLILNHYNHTFALSEISHGAQATVIGKTRHDGMYVVRFQDEEIVRVLAKEILQSELLSRDAQAGGQIRIEPCLPVPTDYHEVLIRLLSHENIASRAPVYEQYDKQVQGRTLLEAGEADAGVMQPFNDQGYPEEIRQTGLALSLDQCPRYNLIDPYWGGVNAVVESARNVAAVGATPMAITDCLCFGNPENPEQFWAFKESIRGLMDACQAIGIGDDSAHSLPIISGNVSFYNESASGAIPPSPMISCIGRLSDVNQVIGCHFQKQDSILVLLGERKNECGGSVYYDLYGELGVNCPQPNLKTIGQEIRALVEAVSQQLILSAHDISEGGVAVAIAEMSFKHFIGVNIEIPGALPEHQKLFSETGGFILEVAQDNLQALKAVLTKYELDYFILGATQALPYLQIRPYIDMPVHEAKQAWENGLRGRLG